MVHETNLFSIQKDPNKPLNITATEIRQYIGVTIYMSLVHLPNVRSFWSEELGFDKVKNTITCNRYEKIRQFLHFNNNETMIPRNNPGYDRLHKIRPFIDSLNKNFRSIPLEHCLSIDE
ncbi:hypothetical protein NQ314_006579 [Rhamnusium bicolor]|uniref:PiggyBac transposable element-derived protein domain-containing protein n=1 Tax=Rhamnusium bicolor TaxID=1586634 RepID=A0AAV8Z034_9CUCU|nr:hypothetical protein NQ314_006579 [Rhamnusium bicolor]